MIRWGTIIKKTYTTSRVRKSTRSAALDVSEPLLPIGSVFIFHRYGEGAKH